MFSDDYVNLRSGAGTNYSVVGCLRKNTKLTFVSTSALYNSAWYKVIHTSTAKTGYIKDYVKMNSSTQPTTKSTQATTKATKPATQPTASASTACKRLYNRRLCKSPEAVPYKLFGC